MKFHAEIKAHSIKFKNEGYIRQMLSKWEGKKVEVSINGEFNKRSINQNKYYWLVLELIGRDTGNLPEDLHRLFKSQFLKKKQVSFKGKAYNMPVSTTELSKGEFVEYMMKIGAEVAELGIVLPSPEDYENSTLLLENEL